MEREARVLSGIVAHVLPRVGSHVKTLDLAHGKAISNEIVRHILDGLSIILHTITAHACTCIIMYVVNTY